MCMPKLQMAYRQVMPLPTGLVWLMPQTSSVVIFVYPILVFIGLK